MLNINDVVQAKKQLSSIIKNKNPVTGKDIRNIAEIKDSLKDIYSVLQDTHRKLWIRQVEKTIDTIAANKYGENWYLKEPVYAVNITTINSAIKENLGSSGLQKHFKYTFLRKLLIEKGYIDSKTNNPTKLGSDIGIFRQERIGKDKKPYLSTLYTKKAIRHILENLTSDILRLTREQITQNEERYNNVGKPWNEEELDKLTQLRQADWHPGDIAKELHRTYTEVLDKLNSIKSTNTKDLSYYYLSGTYEEDLTNTIHDSLQVLECIDENFTYPNDTVLHKLYKCKCRLCNKIYEFVDDDFRIDYYPHEQNFSYGDSVVTGYWSTANCNCHMLSSMQWKVIKILKEHNIYYDTDVSFTDENLVGIDGKTPLSYDFGIPDETGNYKYLIECQGIQHYMPIERFGGQRVFDKQQRNDECKRNFASNKGIFLIEIPYTTNKISEIEDILIRNDIINKS